MTNKHNVRIGLLEPELSYKIQGCLFEVVNKYGRGLKEQIYQKALEEELQIQKLNFESQKRINIYSVDTGKKLGTYIPDLVIENKIIVELKASTFTTQADIAQQRSYLRASAYEIGYLVNFGTAKLEIKRSIYTNDNKPFITKLSH
jgi:GxxExxY protein